MQKKTLSFGMAAAAVILFSVSACGHKTDASNEASADTATEEVAPLPEMPLAENAAEVAVMLDQLTPEEGTKRDSNVYVTPSGLMYRVVKEGTGNRPGAADMVTVNYEGKTLEGKEFDSSYKRGEPTSFPLNQVIAGWTEGLQLMQEGGVYEFYIPSELAYGERGAGADIAPNSDLLFKVELIKVQKPNRWIQ